MRTNIGYDPNAFKDIPENPAIIDFVNCKTLGALHEAIKEGLGFPDYYGGNLDALWDLAEGFREYPITIELRGTRTVPQSLSIHIAQIIKVFQDVHEADPHITIFVAS